MWSHLESFGVIYSHLEPFGAMLSHLELFGAIWAIWSHLEPFGAILKYLEPFGAIWSHMEPVGGIWRHLEPFLLIWSHFHRSGLNFSLAQYSWVLYVWGENPLPRIVQRQVLGLVPPKSSGHSWNVPIQDMLSIDLGKTFIEQSIVDYVLRLILFLK